MNRQLPHFFILATASLLSACGDSKSPVKAAQSDIGPLKLEIEVLQATNAGLVADKLRLQAQIEELQQTPEILLSRVNALLASGDISATVPLMETMKARFGNTSQLKAASAAVSQAQAEVERKQALAKELDARGFYAIKPNLSQGVGNNMLKVESLKLGKSWTFDSRSGGEYHYREAEKESTYLLMNVTVQSSDKDPMLPEVAVYAIDGKQMRRLDSFAYEFRRWQSYGSFIGLYHDFKNDFARASAVPFNAAASVSNTDASKPFAVVVTGQNCHARVEVHGQPKVRYRPESNCLGKPVLTIDDFKSGSFQVVSFFNKPKGA